MFEAYVGGFRVEHWRAGARLSVQHSKNDVTYKGLRTLLRFLHGPAVAFLGEELSGGRIHALALVDSNGFSGFDKTDTTTVHSGWVEIGPPSLDDDPIFKTYDAHGVLNNNGRGDLVAVAPSYLAQFTGGPLIFRAIWPISVAGLALYSDSNNALDVGVGSAFSLYCTSELSQVVSLTPGDDLVVTQYGTRIQATGF